MPASTEFSVAEVNALVPRLEAIFTRLDELQSEIAARANELQRLGYGAPAAVSAEEPEEVRERRRILDERRTQMESELEGFGALGALLMDLELGVLAFPSKRDGQEVYLSWQRGDTAVRYFHRPNEHFIQGRKPLDGGGASSGIL